MKWDTTKHNLEGRVGTPMQIQYKAVGDFKEIDNIVPSCGCTMPKWDEEAKVMTATYTPKPIPKHLSMVGKTEYNTSNMIMVYYKNRGGHDVLSFNAKIKL